jgi:hypothetical protein
MAKIFAMSRSGPSAMTLAQVEQKRAFALGKAKEGEYLFAIQMFSEAYKLAEWLPVGIASHEDALSDLHLAMNCHLKQWCAGSIRALQEGLHKSVADAEAGRPFEDDLDRTIEEHTNDMKRMLMAAGQLTYMQMLCINVSKAGIERSHLGQLELIFKQFV